jgi:hypothetical protein
LDQIASATERIGPSVTVSSVFCPARKSKRSEHVSDSLWMKEEKDAKRAHTGNRNAAAAGA